MTVGDKAWLRYEEERRQEMAQVVSGRSFGGAAAAK